MNKFNMLIVGTGGQGQITLLQILIQAALLQGYDVKSSELHGLSQRGGSVEVHVRFGDRVFSPMVAQGKADLILSLEMQESLKGSYYASPKTAFLINKQIIPVPLEEPLSEAQILDNLKKITENVTLVPAASLCREKLGSEVLAGVYLVSLAVFKKLIPLDPDSLLEAIKKTIPENYLELNLKAFKLASDSEAVK